MIPTCIRKIFGVSTNNKNAAVQPQRPAIHSGFMKLLKGRKPTATVTRTMARMSMPARGRRQLEKANKSDVELIGEIQENHKRQSLNRLIIQHPLNQWFTEIQVIKITHEFKTDAVVAIAGKPSLRIKI